MEESVDTIAAYSEKPAWLTISMVSVGLVGSIAAELVVAGSFSTIADDFGINRQMFGRTTTALTAFFTMLVGVNVWQKTYKIMIVCSLFLLLALPNIIVFMTSNLLIFVIGRFLLGIIVGSFLLMATTTLMTTGKDMERAVFKAFSGLLPAVGVVVVSGYILEETLDRREFELLSGVVNTLAFFLPLICLSFTKPDPVVSRSTLAELLRRRTNRLATLVVVLLFAFQFASIMHLRPFVRTLADDPHPHLSTVILMTFIICHFLGAWIVPMVFRKSPHLKLIALPVVLAGILFGLASNAHLPWLTYVLIALLGFFNGPFLLGWGKWLTRNFSANGSLLLLAVLQLSIALAAAIAGIMQQIGGTKSVFAFSGLVLMAVPVCILVFCAAPDLNKEAS